MCCLRSNAWAFDITWLIPSIPVSVSWASQHWDYTFKSAKWHPNGLGASTCYPSYFTWFKCCILNHLSMSFGVRGSVLQWFTTYLLNRSQHVSFDQNLSKKFNLQCGIPQESCLGPLLFTIYASKLFQVIKNYQPQSHTCADDTQLYLSFNADLAWLGLFTKWCSWGNTAINTGYTILDNLG